ncbi:MAG: 6-carboxytetrahydropterin synthase [Pseudomonadota bacterium]
MFRWHRGGKTCALRVIGHENKCKYLHGHRYVIEATFVATQLDNIGRVVDFGVIKQKLGKWLDDNWDHNCILSIADEDLGKQIAEITNQKIFYLPNNPTAENMADYLLNEICCNLFKDDDIKCSSMVIKETPNCSVKIEDN